MEGDINEEIGPWKGALQRAKTIKLVNTIEDQ